MFFLSIKFRENLICSFCVNLLTDRLNGCESITSLAEVISVCPYLYLNAQVALIHTEMMTGWLLWHPWEVVNFLNSLVQFPKLLYFKFGNFLLLTCILQIAPSGLGNSVSRFSGRTSLYLIETHFSLSVGVMMPFITQKACTLIYVIFKFNQSHLSSSRFLLHQPQKWMEHVSVYQAWKQIFVGGVWTLLESGNKLYLVFGYVVTRVTPRAQF